MAAAAVVVAPADERDREAVAEIWRLELLSKHQHMRDPILPFSVLPWHGSPCGVTHQPHINHTQMLASGR